MASGLLLKSRALGSAALYSFLEVTSFWLESLNFPATEAVG